VEKLTKPVEEADREQLVVWCSQHEAVPIADIELRQPVRIAGEVRSVRIVPRAGADALEASVSDGGATLTAVFLGRRKIPGVSPGRRVILEGVVTKDGTSNVMYNPLYEFA